MLDAQLGAFLPHFQLDPQLDLPTRFLPEERVEIILVYSVGPADGVIEGEVSEPLAEGVEVVGTAVS